MNDDLNHLKILSTFHYVVAAIAGLVACFPIIHLSIGISMLTGGFPGNVPDADLPFPFSMFGLMFTVIPAAFILFGWAFAICLAIAGRFLSTKQHYMFCLIMAGISCTLMPFGTVLGIFTIIVLVRPSVKALFDGKTAISQS